MKLGNQANAGLFGQLSTHPNAGGSMKPRPLKPLSRQLDKYIFDGGC